MVICNIVIDPKYKYDISEIKELPPFVNICTKHWQIKKNTQTLIYGYRLAEELYPEQIKDFISSEGYIRDNLWWTYSKEEMHSKEWVSKFVKNAVESFLRCQANPYDLIFKSDFNFSHFTGNLAPYPLIHAGKYEIYVGEKSYDRCIVHSFQMDNLRYLDIDPEQFFYDLLNRFGRKCVVFSTDEMNLPFLKDHPISFQDLIHASQNEIMTFEEIIRTFSPYVERLSKEMVITYFLRHPLYSPTLFDQFI